MSRSTKKPYFKESNKKDNKPVKRSSNRVIRMLEDADAPAKGKQYKKYFNSYNISDFSIHSPKIKKAYRK